MKGLVTGGVVCAAALLTLSAGCDRAIVDPLAHRFGGEPPGPLPPEIRSSVPEFEEYGTARFEGDSRPARVVTASGTVTRRLQVPASGARLETAVAAPRGTAGFRVTIRPPGEQPQVVEAGSARPVWRVLRLDLSSYAGKPIEYSLETTLAPDQVAFWAEELLLPLGKPSRVGPDVWLITLDTTRLDRLTPYRPEISPRVRLARSSDRPGFRSTSF